MSMNIDQLDILINAQAKNASAKIDALYNSLGKLGSGMKGANSAFNSFKSVVSGTASAVSKGASQIVSHMTLIGRTSSRINKVTSSLKGLLGAMIGFYGVRSLVNLAKDSIELSSSLTEVQNVVEHAFGEEGTKAVENFVSTSITEFGLGELAAKQISSRYQAMASTLGISADMMEKANKTIGSSMSELYDNSTNATSAMSINLTRLAADMASFYNKDQAAVAESLNSVFTGQTRPLRQFGLDITQATLSSWALANGLNADVKNMTQAEKVMLRYQYVMANTAMVQGDFSRTSFTWANQLRILQQQFQMLGKTVGEVLINVFRPMITWLNQAMVKVIAFAETIANALGKIFGWTIIHTPAGAINEDLADTFGDIGDAGDDAADGTKAANKALKEYENTVLGFDELNKLNAVPDNTSAGGSGSGSGSGGTGGSSGASAADFSLAKTDSLIEYYKSSINSLGELGSYISEKLSESMENIDWTGIYAKARGFGTGLAEFLNGLITPRLFGNIGATIASALNTAMNAEDAFLNAFDFSNLGASIGTGINKFFETYDFALRARTFVKLANGIVDTIRVAVQTVNFNSIGSKVGAMLRKMLIDFNWIMAASTFGELVLKIVGGIGSAIDAFANKNGFYVVGRKIGKAIRTIPYEQIFRSIGDVIWKAINGILDFAKGAFDGTPVKRVFEDLKTSINTVVDKIDFDTVSNGFKSIVEALSPAFMGFADGFIEVFEKFFGWGVGFVNGLGAGLQTIADALNSLPPSVVEKLGNALGTVAASLLVINGLHSVGNILKSVTGAFGGGATVASTIGGIGTAAGGAVTPVRNFFSSLFASPASLLTGVITGTVSLADVMQRVQDQARGGNGELSELGTLMGNIAQDFAPELNKKIFNLVEHLESTGVEGEAAANALAILFTDNNIDPSKIEGALRRAQGELNLTEGEVGTVERAIELMGTTFETTASKVNMSESEYSSFQQILRDLAEKGAIPSGEHMEALQTVLARDHGAKTAKTAFEHLKEAMETLNLDTGDFETAVKSKIPSAFGTIGSGADDANKKTTDLNGGLLGFAASIGLKSLVLSGLGGTFGTIGEKAEKSGEKITGVEDDVDELNKHISNKKKDFEDGGKGLMEGVSNGVETGMAGLSTAVLGAATTANSTWTSAQQEHSPSLVWAGFGYNLVAGLINGIGTGRQGLINAINQLVSDMNAKITSQLETFQSSGASLAGRFRNGLQSVSMSGIASSWQRSMNFSGFNNAMYRAGENATTSFGNGMRNVHLPLPHLNFNYNVTGNASSGYRYSYNSGIQWYGLGGFPNMGELFVANERGPEMVGKMGRRNVVASNSQITEGIRAAVVDGMMEAAMSGAFGGRSDSTPVVLNATIRTPDGDVLARLVEKAQARRNARYNIVAQS